MRHRAILSALRRCKPVLERLLDVGSGQGDFLLAAVQSRVAGAYAGFELSESGVRISKNKVPQAEFLRSDIFAPAEEASKFVGWASAVVCSDVIEHVDDPVGFLRAVATYMERDSTLILTVPGGPMSEFDRYIGHRRHYGEALVREVLVRSGFLVERVQLVGFPFFNLYRLLVILRGKRLIGDVESGADESSVGRLAQTVMTIFDFLFRFNVSNSRFGWQVVALARRQSL
jgi:SAM-dependent methyltransferase